MRGIGERIGREGTAFRLVISDIIQGISLNRIFIFHGLESIQFPVALLFLPWFGTAVFEADFLVLLLPGV